MERLKPYLHLYFGQEIADAGGHITTVNESFLKQVNSNTNRFSLVGYKLILRSFDKLTYADRLAIGRIEYDYAGTDERKAELAGCIILNFDKMGALPKTIAYLLSQGFDVFKLIPEGLAVERENITVKPLTRGLNQRYGYQQTNR